MPYNIILWPLLILTDLSIIAENTICFISITLTPYSGGLCIGGMQKVKIWSIGNTFIIALAPSESYDLDENGGCFSGSVEHTKLIGEFIYGK